MRTMQFFYATMATIALALPLGAAQTSGTDRPGPVFMRQKLGFSQGVLEGLTLEKFDLVETNAALLRDMNLTNVFFRLRNAEYDQNIKKFQTKVDRLIRAGKEKNLENAFEAYSQVIGSCVACHKHFRREQFLRQLAQPQPGEEQKRK